MEENFSILMKHIKEVDILLKIIQTNQNYKELNQLHVHQVDIMLTDQRKVENIRKKMQLIMKKLRLPLIICFRIIAII